MSTSASGATPSPNVEDSVGSLKIPPPKGFARKKEDDGLEFETFSRQLKAYLNLQSPRYKELMIAAEQSPDPVGMPTNGDDQELARTLQNFIIFACSDRTGRVVYRDDSDENGFESWRRLYVRYAPSKRVKFFRHMQKILMWRFNEASLETDLNDWEAEIEKYERGSSKTIGDEVKIGVLMAHLPTSLQNHLQLNHDS